MIICSVDIQLNISWHVMRKKSTDTLAAPATLTKKIIGKNIFNDGAVIKELRIGYPYMAVD